MTARYVPYLHHEDDHDPDHKYPYFVSDPEGGYLGPKFTEHQARIIALALNAAADGFSFWEFYRHNPDSSLRTTGTRTE